MANTFLDECTIINIDQDIKQNTIATRREYRLKLPDAIIFATSSNLNVPLLTADQDFRKITGGNIIIFES